MMLSSGIKARVLPVLEFLEEEAKVRPSCFQPIVVILIICKQWLKIGLLNSDPFVSEQNRLAQALVWVYDLSVPPTSGPGLWPPWMVSALRSGLAYQRGTRPDFPGDSTGFHRVVEFVSHDSVLTQSVYARAPLLSPQGGTTPRFACLFETSVFLVCFQVLRPIVFSKQKCPGLEQSHFGAFW